MKIKRISKTEAGQIIETRNPLGLFITSEIYKNKKVYVAIDNLTGDAWTEDFKKLQKCKMWLLIHYLKPKRNIKMKYIK